MTLKTFCKYNGEGSFDIFILFLHYGQGLQLFSESLYIFQLFLRSIFNGQACQPGWENHAYSTLKVALTAHKMSLFWNIQDMSSALMWVIIKLYILLDIDSMTFLHA